MSNTRKVLDRVILGACVALFMFMTVIGTYQISSRYIFKSPSTVSEELISYSFAWMAMLAASYIFGKRDHMRMVFFIDRLTHKAQGLLGVFSEAAIFLFSLGVLVRGGSSITTLTMTQTTPALRISMGYIYAVLPICGVIICMYSLLNIKDILEHLKEEK
ncbi:MAG: TRAP transporter small permease [Cetobacterium sp.]|uniref:TRAP transporter small permease n=1 Tax=Cetobacterium sp. TaxID=2071632 RepID=UPI0025E42D29|nr:TRAP transporter small permease [uncultured Cetobacterium sp.]